MFNTYDRRLLESIARDVNKSYSTYFKHPDVGRPRTASPYRNCTIEISEPGVLHLKVGSNGRATIEIKGLPTIRFRTDKRLPTDEQPKIIRITLKPRRMVVSLVYQKQPKDLGQPAKQSVGIDPGVANNITAVSDDGTVLQIPGIRYPAPCQSKAPPATQDAATTRRCTEGRTCTVHQPEDPGRQDETTFPLDRATIETVPQDLGAAPTS